MMSPVFPEFGPLFFIQVLHTTLLLGIIFSSIFNPSLPQMMTSFLEDTLLYNNT